MDFFAQPPLGADAEAVANDQHPNQQLRIDRGASGMAVVRSEVRDAGRLGQELINPT